MLGIPTVRAAIVVRERRLVTLESHVGAAEDSFTHVVHAVNHVPVVVIGDGTICLDARVGLGNGEEAVDLVRHRRCKDGLAGPPDGCWEIMISVRLIDPDEAHADC